MSERGTSVIDVSRRVRSDVKLQLYVRAGGRCEYDGCNRYLLQHHVTGTTGNFAEMAHIVAFRQRGPRGDVTDRPDDINAFENLLLLCGICHTHIDTHTAECPRDTLEKYKKAHEDRIYRLTECGPDRKTTTLRVRGKIGGQPVRISKADVWAACAPRYPDDYGQDIDLTEFDDRAPGFVDLAATRIGQCVSEMLSSRIDAPSVEHVSVFALAPIPLLMKLGRCLSNKIAAEFFQRHRDTGDWTWKEGLPARVFVSRLLHRGTDRSKIALLLSLSGDVQPTIDPTYSVFEIRPEEDPHPMLVRQRGDLDAFRQKYHEVLESVRRDHPDASEIHVYPALPAPAAVLCGYELFPKLPPALVVYDRTHPSGAWERTLRI